MNISPARKNAIALLAVSLAALMFGLEISSVPVILPVLEKVLHADFKALQWIMNAYTIACTTVLMAAGTLADRYGRRRIFIFSLVSFGLTSGICGLAHSASVLIVSRFLQGMAGGSMLICLIAILSHQFQEGEERSKAFAAFGIILGVGLGLGPIIGGAIVALLSWQWVFLIHVPIAILTLALVSFSVAESRDPDAKTLDLIGIVTLSLAVFGLTYFITQGQDLGFTSLTALTILGAAALSFLAFLFAEKFNAYPMFDFSVFKIRTFSGGVFGSIGMNFSFWPFMIYLPTYFQKCLGYGVVPAGFALLAYTLPTLVMPPLAERLVLRHQSRIVIPAGLFTIGLGFFFMKIGSSAEHASWLTMLPGCLLAGAGLGMTNTPVTNTITGSVSSTRAGMASGIDMSARLITLAINIAVMGFILLTGISSSLRSALPVPLTASQLHSLAETIAAGNTASLPQRFPKLTAVNMPHLIHASLAHGFGIVMIYGGVGVWILAALSYLTFGAKKEIPAQIAKNEICLQSD